MLRLQQIKTIMQVTGKEDAFILKHINLVLIIKDGCSQELGDILQPKILKRVN